MYASYRNHLSSSITKVRFIILVGGASTSSAQAATSATSLDVLTRVFYAMTNKYFSFTFCAILFLEYWIGQWLFCNSGCDRYRWSF